MSSDRLDNPAEIEAQASDLMNRGIERLNEGTMEGTAEALGLFESALSLLRSLPVGDDPRIARQLAMAHQNRGIALQLKDATDLSAITAFEDALGVLAADVAAAIVDREYLQAATLVNLANAWAAADADGAANASRQAAVDAMKLVAETEDAEPAAAEVGLKARHILCRAVARQLSVASSREAQLPEGVHEATDAVDDGLRLVRLWEQKGLAWFRPVAADLLVFGAIVYGTFQPHFVDEFLRENLDPASAPGGFFESAEMQDAIARLNQAFGRNDA
jgi:hypothetical protein